MCHNVVCRGQYLPLLVVFKLIWPQATYIECTAFIANKSNDARVFSKKDVSKALRNFGVQCIQKTAVVDLDFGVQLEM